MTTTASLKRAIEISERIDTLQAELKELLGTAFTPEEEVAPQRRAAGLSATGRQIIAHQNGIDLSLGRGLAPAVVDVLKKAGKPMKVKDIMAGLKETKYKFTSKAPERVLAARIYSLRGVKKIGGGLFVAA